MPERCGARNRRGEPCRLYPLKGATRCKLHGGRSTGAKTPEGRKRVQAAATTHGLRRPFASYEAMLALGQEAEFALAPKRVDLSAEIQFTRAKLARAVRLQAEIEAGAGEGFDLITSKRTTLGILADQTDRLTARIGHLAAIQHEVAPGGDASGAFTVRLEVVNASPKPPQEAPPPPKGTEGVA